MRNEKKLLHILFLAIYFNDLDKVREIKNKYPAVYAQKTNYLLINQRKKMFFDLVHVTFLNEIIWAGKEWIDEVVPFVTRNKERTARMWAFWYETEGRDKLPEDFEYNKYYTYFYCVNPRDEKEKLLPEDIREGTREIDVKLSYLVRCFDFRKVTQCLAQGANPSVAIYKDDESGLLEDVGWEAFYIRTSYVFPAFSSFEKKGYHNRFAIKHLFGDLLGLAAYEKMYHLLSAQDRKKCNGAL